MAPLGDACECAHSELLDLLGAERLCGQVLVRARELGGPVGEPLGRQLVCARVGEVAGPVRGGRDRGRALGRLGELCVVAADEDEPVERRLGRRAGFPPAGVVGAEQEAVHDCACLLRLCQGAVEAPGERAADVLSRLGHGRSGRPDRVCVELLLRAHPDDNDSPRRALVEDCGAARFRCKALLVRDPRRGLHSSVLWHAFRADRNR